MVGIERAKPLRNSDGEIFEFAQRRRESCLAQLLFVCDWASGAAGDNGPADGRTVG